MRENMYCSKISTFTVYIGCVAGAHGTALTDHSSWSTQTKVDYLPVCLVVMEMADWVVGVGVNAKCWGV